MTPEESASIRPPAIGSGSDRRRMGISRKTNSVFPAMMLAGALAFGLSLAAAPAPKDEAESARLFDSQVAPLLAQRCFECHDSTTREGKLDLSSKASALGERRGGRAIVPGNSAESALWQAVEADEMPDDRPPLTPEEKQVLKEWIDSGAVWTAETIDPLAYTRDGRAAYNWIRRLTVPEYIETVRSALGVEIAAEARRILPPDVRADGFQNTAYNLTADLQHVEAYASMAGIIIRKMDVSRFAERFTKCRELNDDCMRELIERMGKWVLRGPLAQHEIESFLEIAHAVKKEKGKFEEAASYVLEGMLQSPRFIYRIEDQTGNGKARPARPFELASRLSYMIWGGPPDEALMEAAESGKLASESGVRSEVERMLKEPRAVKRSQRFLHEWLDLDRLNNLRPDPERFPAWYDQLAEDMRDETLAFFEEVVWKQERPLSDLLNAEVTFATPRLAKFYGLGQEAGESDGPQRVRKGLEALYTFEEGGGDVVRDLSRKGTPIPLKIEDFRAVQWGRTGLTVESPTLISARAPKEFMKAVRKSKAITLEAWITPADAKQDGPARILTISSGTSQRNFTMGQDADKYDVRFRTTKTDANGMPSLASPEKTVKPRMTHVVYTRDASGRAKLYVDGKERASKEVGGNVSNWNHDYLLALANETSKDRAWLGTFHLVAFYSRALSAEEVERNHRAGAGKQTSPALAGASGGDVPNAVQVLYDFRNGKGKTVRDKSGKENPLDLKIQDESRVDWNEDGLRIKKGGMLLAESSAKRLANAIRKTKALTLEAWVTPANNSQEGPARILTFSSGPGERNFTLGQDGNKYQVRFRRKGTDPNGLPGLTSAPGSAARRLTHIVFTRDAQGKARLFIDGTEAAEDDLSGDLSDWKEDYQLALGNETTRDRPWEGTLHLVAVYDRALTPEEVRSTGQKIRRYDLAEIPSRGGLLTHGSVLTVGGEEASTVARGLFILKDFLFSAVGNPPPCADTTPIPAKPGLTRRAIAQTRIDNKACGSCHGKFEPLSFALEKFDGLGAFHEVDEHGNKLREDGEITFPGETEPVAYQTTEEFADLLAQSERVKRNFTRKVTQFAIGRPLVESDRRLMDRIHAEAQKGGGTYSSLITAIATSDLVRMTQTEATH